MNDAEATVKIADSPRKGWMKPERGRSVAPGLHIVSTPIGDLADITLRALDTLAGCDLVACEDTRTTRVLLDTYAISARLTAYHEHNADKARPGLIAALKEGKRVALVSDAGTPLLSDPGHKLVDAVVSEGLPVYAVPGASALLSALVVSALASDSVLFAGFLPAKGGPRRARLAELGETPATLVFYEAPHRIAETLVDAISVFGPDRTAVVARELTKKFEEIRRGSLSALLSRQEEDPARGEIVFMIAPPDTSAVTSAETVDALLMEAVARLGPAQGAAEIARAIGQPKRALYQRALELARKP